MWKILKLIMRIALYIVIILAVLDMGGKIRGGV